MPDDDWALGQNEVDVRNEAQNPLNYRPVAYTFHDGVRHGFYCQDPEADWIAMLADDPDLHMVNADPGAYDRAHPCDCEGTCLCDQEDA